MSLLTVEVEIDHGKLTPKEPHLLPETGRGLLTVLAPSTNEASVRQRVQLPLVQCRAEIVIDPTKGDLDASAWDGYPVIRAHGGPRITTALVREIEGMIS